MLIKPFWFLGVEVGVQNRVGEMAYGGYFSLFNLAFILNILLDLGLNNYNNREIARYPELIRERISAIVPLKFALALVYAIVVLLVGKTLGYTPAEFQMLWLLALNQFLLAFILYFRSNISGLQYFRTDSLLSVMDRSLMIIFTGLLLWGELVEGPFRIRWFVYAQTLSYSLTLLTAAIIVFYRAGRPLPRPGFRQSMLALKSSYPFAMLILLMAFFNRADSVMLERMLVDGKEQAGIYAQSFRIYDAASQFPLLFAGLLLPMFSRMLRLNQEVNSLIRLALAPLLVVAISVALVANFYNSEIIGLLYTSVSANSIQIFGLLMIGFVFVSTSYIYGTLLTANNNLKQLNILASLTVLLNLLLNLILIPRHQALGAAVASLSAQAFYALAQVIIATRLLGLGSNLDLFAKLALFLLINTAVAFSLRYFLDHSISGLISLTASCAVSAFLTRLIRPKELLHILRSKES
ncbi:MAG: hypothetical protein CSA96_04015 [Bacteroidetes bacterium]|nr:MAG: hypothetical protein CSA96_04015 [Bacteroidota bacterium]